MKCSPCREMTSREAERPSVALSGKGLLQQTRAGLSLHGHTHTIPEMLSSGLLPLGRRENISSKALQFYSTNGTNVICINLWEWFNSLSPETLGLPQTQRCTSRCAWWQSHLGVQRGTSVRRSHVVPTEKQEWQVSERFHSPPSRSPPFMSK